MTRVSPASPKGSAAVMEWGSASSSVASGLSGVALVSRRSRCCPPSLRTPSFCFTVRMFIAILMSLCFIALSVTTSSLSGTMVCMFVQPTTQQLNRIKRFMNESEIQKDFVENFISNMDSGNTTSSLNTTMSSCELTAINNAIEKFAKCGERGKESIERKKEKRSGDSEPVDVRHCNDAHLLDWTALQKGIVLAAQNVGCVIMLVTGRHADRLNGKWTVAGALVVSIASNVLIPLLASTSIVLVIFARILSGVSDALMSPSISSMITRWFPPKERPFAIGFITGGRQIGNLLILPVSGYLCSRSTSIGGWKPTFYVSAAICAFVLFGWLLFSADKPSKHICVSQSENSYILRKTGDESLGKRKDRASVPWGDLLRSRPFIVGIFALVCHEYPLVIMLTLLPTYLKEVLGLPDATNGIVSALPVLTLWLSKTLSSSLSSYLSSRKKGCCLLGRTPLVKLFNGVASTGLGLCLGVIPILRSPQQIPFAIVAMCSANAFAGLHTPGVQTALLQIAPAFTGVITGIAFSVVAVASIINKVTNGLILDTASHGQWTLLFEISAVIALLPVLFFSLWGSADLQPWGIPRSKQASSVYTVPCALRYTLYLAADPSCPPKPSAAEEDSPPSVIA